MSMRCRINAHESYQGLGEIRCGAQGISLHSTVSCDPIKLNNSSSLMLRIQGKNKCHQARQTSQTVGNPMGGGAWWPHIGLILASYWQTINPVKHPMTAHKDPKNPIKCMPRQCTLYVYPCMWGVQGTSAQRVTTEGRQQHVNVQINAVFNQIKPN